MHSAGETVRTIPPASLLLAAALAAWPATGAGLEVIPSGQGIRVLVAKQGLFSLLAHDHDLEVTRWTGAAEVPGGDPARASLELSLDAASLRDREGGLLAADRSKVEGQTAGPEVLDAARFPTITFRSERVELAEPGAGATVRGTLHGTLTLRGREAPVDATFEASRAGEAWHVHGQARFLQSAFGMKPYAGLGGTVGVKDQIEVRFEVELRPGGQATPPG
jgi:polyisoprenoid-binding protein YceI